MKKEKKIECTQIKVKDLRLEKKNCSTDFDRRHFVGSREFHSEGTYKILLFPLTFFGSTKTLS